jgi:hypothetical protein
VKRSCLTAHEKTHGLDIYQQDTRRDSELLKNQYLDKGPPRPGLVSFVPPGPNLIAMENKMGFDLSGKPYNLTGLIADK